MCCNILPRFVWIFIDVQRIKKSQMIFLPQMFQFGGGGVGEAKSKTRWNWLKTLKCENNSPRMGLTSSKFPR